ncbi:unnamed protein product [Clonostachys rosea]|uniref:Zn(2)-C6 fungal-type domain-containing protein n=1 Tax=Bionectria ochroleuca TaxID=29856 RepID=A0ABY6V348_BIOOC|nr:unnamed protein product [Clonostachys rosea]
MEPKKGGRPLGRRTACDFCCRKKIKCDGQQPKCSNCAFQRVPCIWTPGVKAKKTISKTSFTEPADMSRIELLESRLDAIEARMENKSQPGLQSQPGIQSPLSSWDRESRSNDGGYEFNESPSFPPGGTLARTTGESSVVLHRESEHSLPPLSEILPDVESYFANFNKAMPLFHQPDFMIMLERWYNQPSGRDEATWAAVNVVLALSLRQTDTQERIDSELATTTYISNAQSVIDGLVTRSEDLKGLQVVLGLAILFLYTSNPYPSCVFIATAIKLVYRLRLHNKETKTYMDPATAAQGDRLFWIAYILDKDISMRAIEPYCLQDNEHDIDIPTNTVSEYAPGTLVSSDGTLSLNFFHHRVQLARIQAKVYDWTFSVRAKNLSLEQHQAASKRVQQMIRHWRLSLPSEFQADKLSVSMGGNMLRHLIAIHSTCGHCLFMAHRIHARDAVWIQQLTEFSAQFVDSEDLNIGSDKSVSMVNSEAWQDFVQTARLGIKLINLISPSDTGLVWSVTCAYQAALVILIANNLTVSLHTHHDWIDYDAQLIDESVGALDKRIRDAGNLPVIRNVLTACSRLNQRAKIAVRLQRMRSIENEMLRYGGSLFEVDLAAVEEEIFGAQLM